jgi:peptidoglycan/xylan/chitin deacetylase (PgdA/CDA1 family)
VELEPYVQAEPEKLPAAGDWRHLIAAGLYQTGLLRALQAVSRHCELVSGNGGGERLRRVKQPKYAVLGYHSVGSHSLPLYCRLPKRVFAEQMRYIQRNYRVISLRQMVDELHDPKPQEQSVVVTFDDGYLGTYLDAFPVLKEYAIPATVYLITASIESGEAAWYDRIFLRFQRATSEVTVTLETRKTFRLTGLVSRVEAATAVVSFLRTLPDEERQRWCESLAEAMPLPAEDLRGSMMNWDQVREMQAAGISFGCHTMTHPVLSRLTPDAVQREVAESKWLIEQQLGVQVDDFAFPFGKPSDCGAVGASALSALGLRTAMTTIVGVNEPGADRFRLRRMVQGDELSLAMFAYRLQRLFFRPGHEEETALAGRAAA